MQKILVAIFLILSCLFIFPPLDSEKIRGQGGLEFPYSVQMHLHGSLSEKLGTMAWHTQQAESTGIDVLWWSDHDHMINLFKEDFLSFYDFESGSLAEEDLRQGFGGRSKRWLLDRSTISKDPLSFSQALVTDEQAYTGQYSFKMFGASGSTHSWQTLSYRYSTKSDGGIRTLLSDVSLNVAVYPIGPITQDTMIFIEIQLSQDLNLKSNFLYYVLSPNPPVSSPNSIFIPLPYRENQWNYYTLPVTADAMTYFPLLRDDQSLHQTSLGIAAKNLAQVKAFFDDFRINTRGAMGDALLALQRTVLKNRYSSKITHHVGIEITNPSQAFRLLAPTEENIHLNALGRKVPVIDYQNFDNFYYPKNAIDHVHRYGGIVSYNHMFGYTNHALPPNLTPEGLKEGVKTRLLANKVYNADLLEIGYFKRRLPLKDFLEVWDTLSLANIFITGTGVTDDHGGAAWSDLLNRFVTWVYAPSKSEEDLITGLKSGHAFFGDPFVFHVKGKLDLTTPEGFRMGQTVITPLGHHQATVNLQGIKAGDRIKLVENGVTTQEIEASGTSFEETFRIDTTNANAVRVEVYTQDGTPEAFSNPIYFLKALPAGGLPVARIPPLPHKPIIASASYSGLGGTDLALWRPSQGIWYILPSSGGTITQPWGLPGDIPTPGDYDGDGKTDMSVWRPLEGIWYIFRSSGGIDTQAFGSLGDIPVPGDYDGDGKTDLAIWQSSGGLWRIQESMGNTREVIWGQEGDVLVPEDYDGDGKTDPVVWRPSDNTWFLLLSTGGTRVQVGSLPGQVPVPGDYNGDRILDLGTWNRELGSWNIRLSSGEGFFQKLGGPEDIPVPGDYDQDGRTDVAVWSPVGGIWTICQSSDGRVVKRAWGQEGDVPVSGL
jgi:hypothetical protein